MDQVPCPGDVNENAQEQKMRSGGIGKINHATEDDTLKITNDGSGASAAKENDTENDAVLNTSKNKKSTSDSIRMDFITTDTNAAEEASAAKENDTENDAVLNTSKNKESTSDSIRMDFVTTDTSAAEEASAAKENETENDAELNTSENKEFTSDSIRMDVTTDTNAAEEVLQFPCYNFQSIHEILNSESFFSPEQYLDSCKWSPDGSCLLTCCADQRLRLFDLPAEVYSKKEMDALDQLKGPFKPSLTVSENGAVYDYEWFPFMSSWSPETACFISASSCAPVHLIDAFTGAVRASYIGYNNVFEVASCFGLTFTCDGGKIYCGYRNMIKIFDVGVPGTTCQTLNTKRLNEQTGYISCISQNPSMRSLFAAGSFSRTIGLYTEEGDAVCLFKGQRNGLTTLTHSTDGTKLFSGSRMDPEILCWDLRNPGEVLHVLPRVMDTNQRIRISVSIDGNHLLSGGTDGVVRIWNLDEVSRKSGICEPTFKFKAHMDCVNGVSLNSRVPVLATSSGKRHTPDLVSDDESDQVFSLKNFAEKTENRVALWWVGPKAATPNDCIFDLPTSSQV